LSLEELEAVRLVDLLELEQEEAAFYMGISRKAFWNDLTSARKKIATALVYGTGILIEGGSYITRGTGGAATSSEQAEKAAGDAEMSLIERELQILRTRLDHLTTRMTDLKGDSREVKSEVAKEGDQI
jgi:chromosome segregation ATPase